MLFFMNLYWFQFIVWLIIRIIIGKSSGVEDTREIPNESKKKRIPGQEASGEELENGKLSATNHGEVALCMYSMYGLLYMYVNLCSCKCTVEFEFIYFATPQI